MASEHTLPVQSPLDGSRYPRPEHRRSAVSAGCLKLREDEPVVVVMPNNWWYKESDSEERVDSWLTARKTGKPAKIASLPRAGLPTAWIGLPYGSRPAVHGPSGAVFLRLTKRRINAN
jgi:hypothetical protein